jgi:hypothetical protein
VAYFDDLSPYRYLPPDAFEDDERYDGWDVLSVGWLQHGRAFVTGATTDLFREALLRLCVDRSVGLTRGFHRCDLVPCEHRGTWPPRTVHAFGKQVALGSAEIRVEGANRVCYAAPNLIYHYVAAHDYQPPVPFIEAVHQQASRLPVNPWANEPPPGPAPRRMTPMGAGDQPNSLLHPGGAGRQADPGHAAGQELHPVIHQPAGRHWLGAVRPVPASDDDAPAAAGAELIPEPALAGGVCGAGLPDMLIHAPSVL